MSTRKFESGPGFSNQNHFVKIYMLGEKDSGLKRRGSLQNYKDLKAKQLQQGGLFEDENFPVDSIELANLDKLQGVVEWKRPPEIITDPEFIVEQATRFDVDQGGLGDCWFLAAIANLTSNKRLFSFVVPPKQSFSHDYAGIFHFRFWQYGRWVDVVIDDKLPTIANKLIYLKSTTINVFWSALLEKAYAKLYGSYKHIEAGQISEALEDMCGGLSESYLANNPYVFDIIEMSYQRKSFMGCSISDTKVEGERPDGLITTHAYSIIEVLTLNVNDADVKLLRLRQPWGDNHEWKGAWSDNSEHWLMLPKETRDKYLSKKADGEFWMQIEDFQKCFTFLDICHLNPSSFLYEEGDHKKWCIEVFEGSWIKKITAGGGINHPDTIGHNPQYCITIRGDDPEATYAVVIGLMQKNKRFDGKEEELLEINIYRINTLAGHYLNASFFQTAEPAVHKQGNGMRQLTIRTLLPTGKYCIIPSTINSNIPGKFLLRIYSEADAHAVENDSQFQYGTQQPAASTAEDNQVVNGNSGAGWYQVQKQLNMQYEKKRVLCFLKSKNSFSKTTCKSLVALRDQDTSGTLDSQEFINLLREVAGLKVIFNKYDKNSSGEIDGFEFRSLLNECGYKVNRKLLVQMTLRYGTNGRINFENFVLCAFKLKTMIAEYKRRTANNEMRLNIDDWLQTTLSS